MEPLGVSSLPSDPSGARLSLPRSAFNPPWVPATGSERGETQGFIETLSRDLVSILGHLVGGIRGWGYPTTGIGVTVTEAPLP